MHSPDDSRSVTQMAGISMLQVSYPGDSPALVALLGGHVLFAFNNVVAAHPHIQSGRLRPMAVATAQRVSSLPEIPTIAESGLSGYEGLLFYSLMGPARLPQPIVIRLNEAVTKIKQSPEVRQNFARLGAVSIDMTPQELGAFLQKELDKWTRVIQTGDIKSESN